MKKVVTIEEITLTSMTVFAISNIFLTIFLSIGLKYLWNPVNILQFMVYIPMYKLTFPSNALGVFNFLKMIALLEFIPTIFITNWTSDMLL